MTEYILWGGGLAALALGFLMTFQTVGRFRELSGTLAVRERHRDVLERLRERVRPYEEAVHAYESLEPAEPRSVEALVDESLPGATPADVRELERPAGRGWQVVERELTFRDARIEQILGLVPPAEACRPPWRLSKCVIRASQETPGRGQAILRFESLRRGDAG